ncbi:MAG TPA: hypothetical protein VMX94_03885 [Armatimonadota bacterium]|nr:hypothetical protein [Armatimonadota bacterium]
MFVTCILVSAALASSASAKFVPRISVQKDADGAACIIVNRQRAVQLKVSNGSLSPGQRAKIVAGRLASLVQRGLDPKTLWCKQSGADARVMVGDSLLVIATAAEAKAQNTSSAKLAEKWTQSLREALSLPPLMVTPSSLLIPLGEARAVTVHSLLTAPVEADVSNPLVISVDGLSKPGSLIVTGASPGDAAITIRCQEYSVPLRVSVRKYAAYKTTTAAKAVVTGWNAPPSLVSQAAAEAVTRAISLEPGARLISANVSQAGVGLSPGNVVQMPVEVQVAGGDYIPTKLAVQVEVENRILPRVQASHIMYSNHPESILKYQALFVGRISPSEGATRLLYHHQNRMKKRIGFVIDVVNPWPSAATLHIVEGVSWPMLDTVAVGYRAGSEFLDNHRKNIGRVIELPPRARQALVSQSLDALRTASGLMELRQLSGDPVFVRVMAKPESERLMHDQCGITVPAVGVEPSKLATSDHVYPGPMKNLAVTYTAGKPWLFVRIGKEALTHATQDRQLQGNYGVIYDIEATLENPLDRPHNVEIAFEATAGLASGVFFLNGSPVHVRWLQSLREATIGTITVPPGRSRTVSLRTMPLSGSAYPATIIIRPAGASAAMSGSHQRM